MAEAGQLVIYGASYFARTVAHVVDLVTDFTIAGYLHDDAAFAGAEFNGSTILGGRDQLATLREQGVRHAVLGFGDCDGRLSIGKDLADAGFEMVTLVHPSAVLAPQTQLEPGSLLLAGAVLDNNVSVGANAIIGKNAVLGHDTTVGTAAHVASGVCVGGLCAIGKATLIGLGSAVRDRTRIGARSIVGAGSAVVAPIPDNVVAYGNPAAVVRPRE